MSDERNLDSYAPSGNFVGGEGEFSLKEAITEGEREYLPSFVSRDPRQQPMETRLTLLTFKLHILSRIQPYLSSRPDWTGYWLS